MLLPRSEEILQQLINQLHLNANFNLGPIAYYKLDDCCYFSLLHVIDRYILTAKLKFGTQVIQADTEEEVLKYGPSNMDLWLKVWQKVHPQNT